MVESKPSNKCLSRCIEIADVVKSIEPSILQSSQAQAVVQNLVISAGWAKKYDKKCCLKKIFMNGGYKKKFEVNDRNLSQSYIDFVLSLLLVKIFPDLYAVPNMESFSNTLNTPEIILGGGSSEIIPIKRASDKLPTIKDLSSENSGTVSLLDILYPEIKSPNITRRNNLIKSRSDTSYDNSKYLPEQQNKLCLNRSRSEIPIIESIEASKIPLSEDSI
jgi:hypothetical protein